jgi:2-haloacid dehalogenase
MNGTLLDVASLPEPEPFPDAAAALGILREAGINTGTLTNSGTEAAELALDRAGLGALMDAVIGTDAAGVAERLGVQPDEICLVAAHAWDVSSATRAGLRAAWVARQGRQPAPRSLDPEIQAQDLVDAVHQIVS